MRRGEDTLREALGPNGALIINLVLELEFIIGKQPPIAGLSPEEMNSTSRGSEARDTTGTVPSRYRPAGEIAHLPYYPRHRSLGDG